MKTKQKNTRKGFASLPHALSALLVVFGFATVLVVQSPNTAAALTVQQCINKYDGDLLYEVDKITDFGDSKCSVSDKGPCEVGPVPTDRQDELPDDPWAATYAVEVNCDPRLVPGNEEKLTKQQCMDKYHGILEPSEEQQREMRIEGCTADGRCTVRTTIILTRIIDCKGEYTNQAIYCKQYENAKENKACRDGYLNGQTACGSLSGKAREACDDGAAHGDKKDEGGGTVNNAGCGAIATSIIKCGNRGGNPITNLFLDIVNFLAVGVGIVVVGGIVWGAITYIRSNGNSSVAQQGITIIVNSVVGLLLFIFMYAIINFLVPGGLFT